MQRVRHAGIGILGAGLVTALVAGVGVNLAVAQVNPPMVMADLLPNQSINVNKVVTTPAIPPNPDIVFYADTTGSMAAAIANVQANATAIMNTVQGAQPTAQFAVAEYRDAENCVSHSLHFVSP